VGHDGKLDLGGIGSRYWKEIAQIVKGMGKSGSLRALEREKNVGYQMSNQHFGLKVKQCVQEGPKAEN